jgi:hypothetical protein
MVVRAEVRGVREEAQVPTRLDVYPGVCHYFWTTLRRLLICIILLGYYGIDQFACLISSYYK